ncbi:conserved hypothetical protein [Nostocoides japonicum T1-X7]|uniref:HTH marR-type domain-containing protein n=1 Tax=Nostocoides japonicum T1-X7 TaxID=1194083 RepID=A0A077LU47_9MICO|nr:MarR family transcriptional regulator [Tetrasphaera japonica]CCH77233.1 conserved hypothetical protein [Tetrasphaera japonica T1-X7]
MTHDEDVALFIERLGTTLTSLGMQRVPARVFAALMADEDGRMTSAELTGALRLSASSVSGAVRYLSEMRMIHREREPGTRRDVYVVAQDQWHYTLLGADQIYGRLKSAFAGGVAAVGGADSPAGARLETSVRFLDFITTEMKGIAERWEALETGS